MLPSRHPELPLRRLLTVWQFASARLLLLLCAMLAVASRTAAAGAAVPEIQRAAIPAWVKPAEVDLSLAKPAGISGGEYRLLTDRQVNAADSTRFSHVATLFLTENGVEEGARITITFEPSYETVTMHRLIVHRDGKAIDRLASQEIKVIQREERLDWHLYDGRLSAEVILEDIRVGDVLEYAYSIHGSNPIFGGRYLDDFYTDRPEPVHYLRNRLLWPSDRHLGIKEFGTKLAPTVTANGPLTEYVWERRDVPAVISDGESPSWFDPYGWIQFTEFDSWGAVAAWANGIYIVPDSVPDEVEKECRQIAPLETEEARVLAALRYVQDNIRYLGMEIGVNSHKPYSIETILERRFGDCKDKALLLCTILRHLGFDARPAVVGTDYRRTIGDWLPTPLAFNHLVVHLSLYGKVFWLDPTRHDQGGPLEQLYFPDFGWALVVSPGTTALTPVTPAGFKETARELHEFFDFPDFNGTATLRVTNTWRGHEADKMRSHLATTSREEMEKDTLNDYASIYPRVEPVAAARFQDDRAKDVIVSEETFRLSGFWKPDDRQADLVDGTFSSEMIRELATRPATRVRTAPYAVNYPKKMVHLIEIHTPRALTLDEEHLTIDNPAFAFHYSAVQSKSVFTLGYTYESRRDHVPAADTAKYLDDLENMRDHLTYQLSIPRHWLGSGAAAGLADSGGIGDGVVSKGWAAWLWVALTAGAAVAIYSWKRSMSRPVTATGTPALHRCAVCGETEDSNPSLEFRVAVDGLDYCQRHLPARPSGAK